MTAGLWRRPGDQVDACCVEGEVVDALPLVVLLAPDKDLAVVGGRCEDSAVFGVCLQDACVSCCCYEGKHDSFLPMKRTKQLRHVCKVSPKVAHLVI